jgi:hypothetical protein
MAWFGSMLNVSGINSAIAVVPPRPGITPNNSPTTTPSDRAHRVVYTTC